MRTLNLGILAHVDAGKTSLTERLLYDAGVIDAVGSVDRGDTHTDTLDLERRRGITIRSAVVSFAVGDVTVNLIDTPGHPDFIAEVERVLNVLDGAVLVVSAVEGVQAQTRVLLRTLRRLGIPTLVFVNKIDRAGAEPARVLREVRARLSPSAVATGTVTDAGTPAAAYVPFAPGDPTYRAALVDVLAEHDDAVLAAYVDEPETLTSQRVQDAFVTQARSARVYPVFFGSAITGAGVEELTTGITHLLPAAEGDAEAPASGSVFKIERGDAGERIAYLRMFSGTVRVREKLAFGGDEGKVTGIGVFQDGAVVESASVEAGRIAQVRGLAGVRVGDAVGVTANRADEHHFAPPTLETVVVPRRASDRGALRSALAQLAEQDPLIGLRQDDVRQEIYVSLYGEVQKEVVQATLAGEFGLDVGFEETTTICVERPVGTGADVEHMGGDGNPFRATVGLRVEPGAVGSGVRFRLGVELGSLPLAFFRAVEETVDRTLTQGLHGWPVIDCVVTMTHSAFTPPPPYGWSKWSSSASDFRNLTPLVLMSALAKAGTVVHEPMHRFRLELPADALGPVLPVLARLGAVPHAPELTDAGCVLEGDVPAARVHELQQRLPALTRGEGVLESAFDHYRPVRGPVPSRARTDHNPLNRKEYLTAIRR
ncbi:MAG TPA: translation factor GTPase family protein [Streptosporangiales bacterium]